MTALASLHFIAMIPIDCKITNFSLYLFVYFYDMSIGAAAVGEKYISG